MNDPIEIDPKDAARLTLLRRLVTTLLVVMIGGFLVLIGLLVTRFPDLKGESAAISFDLPENLALPEGLAPEAFTRGSDWVAIVARDAAGGSDEEILIFDAATGALRQRIGID
ncbi:DUF6476 family protein [Celeribacter neptunius]|uniref:Uncharacterized protein n=1 Tax=Celeribacter neptunius TaxID=588602 RepID=A0A1I3IRD5_9RHOB|nr:DUF6476 family protein [Celeribacter neptunius]SFI50323.1 hypothetical protein SAMN04487991_0105 [Celeribacter neptunius]